MNAPVMTASSTSDWRQKIYEGDWADEDQSYFEEREQEKAGLRQQQKEGEEEEEEERQLNTEEEQRGMYKRERVEREVEGERVIDVRPDFARRDQQSYGYNNSYNNNYNSGYNNSYNNSYNNNRYPSSRSSQRDHPPPEFRRYDKDYRPSRPFQRREYDDSSRGPPHASQITTSMLYKTKMCEKFLETGECPYSTRCVFAHGEEELRKLRDSRPPRDSADHSRAFGPNPLYKTVMCTKLNMPGGCPHGSRCNYAHSSDELRDRPAAAPAPALSPTTRPSSFSRNSSRPYSSSSYSSSRQSHFNQPSSPDLDHHFDRQLSFNNHPDSDSNHNDYHHHHHHHRPSSPSPSHNPPPDSKSTPRSPILSTTPSIPPSDITPTPHPKDSLSPESKKQQQQPQISQSKPSQVSTPPPPPPLPSSSTSSRSFFDQPKRFAEYLVSDSDKHTSTDDKSRKVVYIDRNPSLRTPQSIPHPLAAPAGASPVSADHSADQSSAKSKIHLAELHLANTYSLYFYNSTSSANLISRPLAEEIKFISHTELRSSLSKKSLLTGLFCGIFLPTSGKLVRSFVEDRISLIKKSVISIDPNSYFYAVETLLLTSPDISAWSSSINNILKISYLADVFDEDSFISWYNSKSEKSTSSLPSHLLALRSFYDWLSSAEDE
ncbi:Zinc finger protein 36, C3H1 type-like 1 [Zancudomyces culisetae]|nr:Zinc finger protein 36, C3H1 type-like 1 [Zancudomyces culisetae]|eukprot:OMH83478.1 Zinc finger protein 36, C3H1 type-like 1 [Zancudomyces culisetae]